MNVRISLSEKYQFRYCFYALTLTPIYTNIYKIKNERDLESFFQFKNIYSNLLEREHIPMI